MKALQAGDLLLEPLTAAHAESMLELLRDPTLYRYLDHPPPPTVEHLRSVYVQLETRTSPAGSEQWLNWIVRPRGARPIGYVQATLRARGCASIGFVFGKRHWGRGHATHACGAMLDHLALAHGVGRFRATVELANDRSIRVLRRLCFRRESEEESKRGDLSSTEWGFVHERPVPRSRTHCHESK